MGVKTEYIAWFGAVLSFIVFLWELYKYKQTRPILRIKTYANMQKNIGGALQGHSYVMVDVVNIGERPTTLTNLSLKDKNLRKQFVVIPAFAIPFPYVLKPGEIWTGGIEQDKELEDMAKNGKLFYQVHHAWAKKPSRKRIIIEEEEPIEKLANNKT